MDQETGQPCFAAGGAPTLAEFLDHTTMAIVEDEARHLDGVIDFHFPGLPAAFDDVMDLAAKNVVSGR